MLRFFKAITFKKTDKKKPIALPVAHTPHRSSQVSKSDIRSSDSMQNTGADMLNIALPSVSDSRSTAEAGHHVGHCWHANHSIGATSDSSTDCSSVSSD